MRQQQQLDFRIDDRPPGGGGVGGGPDLQPRVVGPTRRDTTWSRSPCPGGRCPIDRRSGSTTDATASRPTAPAAPPRVGRRPGAGRARAPTRHRGRARRRAPWRRRADRAPGRAPTGRAARGCGRSPPDSDGQGASCGRESGTGAKESAPMDGVVTRRDTGSPLATCRWTRKVTLPRALERARAARPARGGRGATTIEKPEPPRGPCHARQGHPRSRLRAFEPSAPVDRRRRDLASRPDRLP